MALRLYRKQKPRIKVAGVELRAWQQKVIKIIQQDSSNNRTIYWISGAKGNEGKLWMQCYVEAYDGYSKDIRLEISNKTRHGTFATANDGYIFLLNDTRATNMLETNLAVLELIKDGNEISSKYNSQVLTFKVPNIVIIFQTICPTKKDLKDRWEIYTFVNYGFIRG